MSLSGPREEQEMGSYYLVAFGYSFTENGQISWQMSCTFEILICVLTTLSFDFKSLLCFCHCHSLTFANLPGGGSWDVG